MKLRVLLILPIEGGALIVGSHVLDALQEMHAVEVDMVATQALHSFYEKSFRHIEDITERRKIVLEHINLAAMGKLVQFKPDLVLVMALAPVTPWFIENANALGAMTAHWYVENFRYYPSNPLIPPWQVVAKYYQHFFTIQKGAFHTELERAGIQHYHYLPTACNPKIHNKNGMGVTKERYRSDVGFVGFHYPNRIKVFKALQGVNLALWGPGWHDIEPLRDFSRNEGGWIDGKMEAQVYRGAKIGLNIHSSLDNDVMVDRTDFLNPRVFTIPACGAFQLVDTQDPLGDVYDIGGELDTYDSVDVLKRKIEYYLKNDDEKEKMALRGFERTMAEHTYRHRMERLLNIVGLQ